MTDTPPPPAAQEVSTGFDQSGLLSAISSSKHAAPQNQEPAAPVKPQEAPKPKAEAPAKAADTAPKKPWEKSVEPSEAEPEVSSETPDPKIEEPPVDMKPEAKTRWGELRKKEEQLKTLQPEFEKLKAELEALRKAEPQVPEAVQKELEELRQHRAAYAVELTPEWQEAVEAPYAKASDRLAEVADFAKVDFNKLLETGKQPNKLMRAKEIRAIMQASEEGVEETEINEAVAAVNDIVELSLKAKDLRDKARDIQKGLEGRERAASEEKMARHNKLMEAASGEVYTALSTSFKATGLLDNPELAKALQTARPANAAEEPNQAVYEAQAGLLMPAFVEYANKLAAEVTALRKAAKARAAASPSSAAPASVAPDQQTNTDPLAELQSLVAASNRR